MKQSKPQLQIRKLILIALLIFPFSIIVGQSTNITRLGIVNPTPGNISNTLNLVEKQFIKADSLVIVGIYHESQAFSIAATDKFIKEKGYSHITIEQIKGELTIQNLFETNNCTVQFQKLFEIQMRSYFLVVTTSRQASTTKKRFSPPNLSMVAKIGSCLSCIT